MIKNIMNKPNQPGRSIARFIQLGVLALLLLTGCAGKPASAAGSDADGGSSNPPAPGYLDLFEGLHVTGTPIDVDIATFRLKVEGAVERPLSLSFEQIKKLPAVREEFKLECPGFFVDRGVWTGVPVRELLARAVASKQAKRVAFTSLDGGYTQWLTMEDLQADGILIAYEFDGKLFHRVHGFPLRLTARGKPGSYWVKWLGSIRVEE
jgi:sulfoxide reductase catalytic subunit YedY